MRFELTTLTLARLCSTPELRPHPFREAVYNECVAQRASGKCSDMTKKFNDLLTCRVWPQLRAARRPPQCQNPHCAR